MAFNTRIILHVSGILLNVALFSFFLTLADYYVTKTTLALLLILQIGALIRYVTLTNRQLARFFSAVKHSDFSQSFQNTELGSSFRDLGQAMDALMDKFRATRSDKENIALYLTTLIEQIPIAICSLADDGTILLSNQAFKRLFRLSKISRLDDLQLYDPELVQFLKQLQPGEEEVYKSLSGETMLHLKSSCTILRTQGRQEKLVSLQNIQGEMESQELEAWQNLIRVMSHEIMNSVTPITSLAETSSDYVKEAQENLANGNTDISGLLEDANSAMQTISKRGQGLIRFVESYRSMMRLPTPRLSQFRIDSLLGSVEKLMEEEVRRRQCQVEYEFSPANLSLRADPEQLEQALLNLLKNALDAIEDVAKPEIKVIAWLGDYGRFFIEVADNGCGMNEEALKNLFTPFFTTKRDGSGIGMSLVKKIVNMNGGSISISSIPKNGTRILMTFRT